MYLPALTDDELLRYASTQQLTPLEAELVRRLSNLEVENEENANTAESLSNEIDQANARIDELNEELIESLA